MTEKTTKEKKTDPETKEDTLKIDKKEEAIKDTTPIITRIQEELKAPKDKKGVYGSYRNAEQIEKALKPLLVKYNSRLSISTIPIMVGERYYIKATVNIYTPNNSGDYEEICTDAYAREESSRRGMDGSQTTGSATSYAIKYALQAMFLIDDSSNDPDSLNNTQNNYNNRGGYSNNKNYQGRNYSNNQNNYSNEQNRGQQANRSSSTHNYTKEELKSAKVEYIGTRLPLTTIWEFANQNNPEAREWINQQYKNPSEKEHAIVKAFVDLAQGTKKVS